MLYFLNFQKFFDYYLLSVIRYTMALTKIRAQERFQCIKTQSITYRFHLSLEAGSHYDGLSEIQFTLNNVPKQLALDCKAKQIKGLFINQQAVKEIKHQDGFIYLDTALLKEGVNYVAINYRTKYDNDGNGCVSFIDVDEKQYLYTQFEPYYANRVFALFDQPDLKAPMQLTLIWPESFKEVISNEQATISQQYNEQKLSNTANTFHKDLFSEFIKGRSGRMTVFPKTKMLPTYLYCFVAGPYERLKLQETYHNIPMSLYCIESLFPYMKQLAPFVFQITIQCMKFFESFFGVPYSFNKYDQVFAHEYKCGAMQNAGIVTFNDLYIWKEKVSTERMLGLANTISHELSHHWFGNLVTMKWWDDLWLNQSFADFISHFSLEKIKGNLKTINYQSSMASFLARKAWGYHEDQLVTTHPISGEVANTIVADSIFDGITYSKGASTMKQLLYLMSQDSFSAGLKDYFEKYGFKNASLTNFITELQKHFKHEGFNLEEWRGYWLQKASLNQLEPVWDAAKNSDKEILTIRQTPVSQDYPTLRPHKIKIALFKQDSSYDVIEALIQPQEQTQIEYNGSNNYKAILLNYEDHTFAKVVIDSTSLNFFSSNMLKVKDILTRTLIWRSFFDMVKDGIIPSTRYIEIFTENIREEVSDTIFQRHFDYIYSSINSYTPLKYRNELNTRLFYFILDTIPKIPQNKQNRLVILRQKLVQYAHSQLAVRLLISWKRGKYAPLNGHKMSVGQQWSTVIKAFAQKNIEKSIKDQLLAEQSQIDKSDVCKLKNATCKSLSANKEQFQKIYESLKDPKNEQSITLKRAVASGWNHRYHVQQLKQYKQRYFKDIVQVSEILEGDHLQLFIQQLQPIDDNLAESIQGYKSIKLVGQKFDKISRDILKTIDDLKRRLRAYEAFQKNLVV